MDRELLIEIGVEELPASWLPGLTAQLADRLAARLKELRLAAGAPIETYGTPRRLTARIARIAERQEDLEEVITGPPVSAAFDADGQPTPAAVGFARKQGVTVADLGRTRSARGEYLTFLKRQRGRSALDTLPDVLGGMLRDLAFPKQMRWDALLEDGRGELVFGRPIRWLVFLYGGRVVPFTISRPPHAAGPQVQDVQSGALTYGHRFLATSGRAGRSIRVRSFDEYQARLKEHFIVLDHAERRDRIARELEGHARRLGGRVALKDHQALLEEVADLVEYPAVVAGFFDPAFLTLPQEVLSTTLVHHQHFFPVVSLQGELREAFLAVVNTQPKDERLIAKNAERVVTARLRDARFFWESDRRAPLASRLDRLDTLLFHKRLGSYRDKTRRIEALASWLAGEAFGCPDAVTAAATAARLAKADLTTDMVFEFPELQGVMGGIYARAEGQPEEVWKAIYHHYLPVGVEADAPPSKARLGAAAVTWAAVSLADKLDTLVGLMVAGEKPSGSRDPFGLRRAAHGVMKLLVDLEAVTGVATRPVLDPMIAKTLEGFGAEWPHTGTRADVLVFLTDRVRHLMQARGLQYEEIHAVTWEAERIAAVNPTDLLERAVALARVRETPQFAAVAEAFKRANNIVVDGWGEAETRGRWGQGAHLLHEPAELALTRTLGEIGGTIRASLAARNPGAALEAVGSIGDVLGQFFSDVRVNVPDEALREARLALLAELRDRILEVGDIAIMVQKRVEGAPV
jgi:glycyl-tRNA synthetase beta chain